MSNKKQINDMIIDEQITFYYKSFLPSYNPDMIRDAYSVENEEMDEDEFSSRYDEYYDSVIEHIEDECTNIVSRGITPKMNKVQGIDLRKDGLYIEDVDSCLFALVMDGEILLRYE